jgi:nucleotide-binding universal stress UspA family protein
VIAMVKIERIVCPVDFSEFSAKAFDYAYSLARHYGARLLVEHVVQPLTVTYPYYGFPDSTAYDVYGSLASDAEQRLKELVQARSWDGLQPEWIVQKGLAADSILGLAKTQSASLIVMGTHGRRGLDRLTMGSVTERVLRKSQCPVLVVRKPAHDFCDPKDLKEPVHLSKILLCTDFSDYALRALDYAFSLAMEYNAELTLLHVLENVHVSTDLGSVVAHARDCLDNSIPNDAVNWCKFKSVVRIGRPYQEIVQLAIETQSDLIILGVRGRNALNLALFGSTTHRVIQLGSCPVLAVHI